MYRYFATAFAALAFAAGAHAQSVYSFGDSLSDAGNVDNLTAGLGISDDYYEGRFSNGPVWVEFLSQSIAGRGQRLNPGLWGPHFTRTTRGYNFAHGGAVTSFESLNAEDALGFRPPDALVQEFAAPFVLIGQAKHFRDQSRAFGGRAFRAGADDFATITSGGNDYLNGGDDSGLVVRATIEAMEIINQRGVRNFILFDMPALGHIPSRIGGDDAARLNAVADAHNAALAEAVTAFETDRGANVVVLPVSELLEQVIADADHNNGARFGFTTVRPGEGTSGTCLGDGLVLDACPDSYFFYDGLHPTASAHALVGRLAYAALVAETAAATDGAARLVSVQQVGALQNRILSARRAAARVGARRSGTLTDRAGGTPAAAGFGLRETQGENIDSGAISYFRYIDGAAPGHIDLTPGDFGSLDAARASLSLSQGEYTAAYGADIHLSDRILIGALATRTARDTDILDTNRREVADTYAVYAAWTRGSLDLGLSAQGGRIDQDLARATGLQEAPLAAARASTRHATTRLDADYRVIPPLALRAKVAAAHINHAGYQETGALGLVDLTVPSRTDAGLAAYIGASANAEARLAGDWIGTVELETGLLAASSDIGYAALLDAPGLIAETLESTNLFPSETGQDQVAALIGARIRVAGSESFALTADFDALLSETGPRHAATLRGAWRF